MTNRETIIFQMSLEGGQAELKNIRRFSKTTVIYPEGRRASEMWILTDTLVARKLPYQVRGLKGYKAMTPIESHHDGKDWSLPEGTHFGAFANTARKITFAE